MDELNVKCGDKVSLSFGNEPDRLEYVLNVTRAGIISVTGTQLKFDRSGNRIGGRKWEPKCSIRKLTEEEMSLVNKMENHIIYKAYKLCHNIKLNDLSFDQSINIIKILEGK